MFINKKMNFIMDESDVMTVIKIIDKHHKNHIFSKNYCVKNCGWADVSKWFILGDVTRKSYNMIISDLRKQFKLEEKELKRIYLTKIES